MEGLSLNQRLLIFIATTKGTSLRDNTWPSEICHDSGCEHHTGFLYLAENKIQMRLECNPNTDPNTCVSCTP